MSSSDQIFDLSFVILTWNSESYIDNCIYSIEKSFENSRLKYEIFIVDNGSQDGTVTIIEKIRKKSAHKIHLIKLNKNAGTTYPRNVAIKKAAGRYICIMDSDVEIFPGTVETLMEIFKKDPSVGLSVPKLIYPDGNLQKSTDRFPTVFRKVYRYFFLKKIEAEENNSLGSASQFEVDYAISALWLTKKSVFNKVGLLDENIFYSPEDVDFCLRVWKAGYKIFYNPGISAVHHTQEISRGFKLNKAFFDHVKGLFYYFLKHRYFFRAPDYK